jgi:ABC-type Co2+ transport system permease subunit
MRKLTRFLALVGLCGAGMFLLACIFSLSLGGGFSLIVGDIGLVLLFGCAASVIACFAINGYNPVEP